MIDFWEGQISTPIEKKKSLLYRPSGCHYGLSSRKTRRWMFIEMPTILHNIAQCSGEFHTQGTRHASVWKVVVFFFELMLHNYLHNNMRATQQPRKDSDKVDALL